MTVELTTDSLRLTLDPAAGVQWLALEARHDGRWLSLVPDCRTNADASRAGPRAGQDESAPLPAASFHMLPYSNRVRDGRFTFDGRTIQLGRAERHAIHGTLRKRDWTIVEQDDTRLSCRFDSRDRPAGEEPIDWPWPLDASLVHELIDARLTSTMALTNRGDTPMPAGLGWHPYFVREIVPGAHPELTLPIDGVLPDADGDCLPDGAPIALPPELDFRAPRALDPAQRIDRCLSGLAGAARIRWPDADIGFSLQASPVCRHLVLFNPDMPHFAVEPVSNANDGFNLQARGIDAGVQVLAPGDTLRATMTLTLDAG